MMTIIDLFEKSVRNFPDNIFLWQKTGNSYEGTSYSQVHKRVCEFAAGLMKSGLLPGDRVSLLAEGRNDWVVSELGILYNGAVNVPLSVKLNEPEEILFRLSHSGSKMAIVSQSQLSKILAVADSIPLLETIVCLDKTEVSDTRVKNIETIIEAGKAFLELHGEEFVRRFKSITDDNFANICYTSGTTADPKGIVLSHRNYTANVEQASSLFSISEWYTTLLILPWDHAFAHTCGIYALMKHGASLASVKSGSTPMETIKNISGNIKEVKPVILFSVPALAKNFKKSILNGIKEKGKVTEKLFRHALHIAYKYNGNGWDRGNGFRKIFWPLNKLYDILLFSKIRQNFGGRLKFFVGGGALLDTELQQFFYALGIPMYQGYGLTEAAPVITANNPDKHKLGSSGALVSQLELSICDENDRELPVGEKGEIVVKGENVMKGYWQNESATKEALKNGWLHTGDLGFMDKDGFLYVLGRYKSLLIADDGEKYSPEGIEEAMTGNSIFIDQCMLYNNQKSYTVCLLVPNKETVRRYLMHSDKTGNEKAISALKLIDEELNKYRKHGVYETMFPQRWLPAAIGVLSEGFTEENHLMNSTMKIVRGKIEEKYTKLLGYLYTPEAKNIYNSRNIEVMLSILE
jgi:long-chain acyl-CoA synthetase